MSIIQKYANLISESEIHDYFDFAALSYSYLVNELAAVNISQADFISRYTEIPSSKYFKAHSRIGIDNPNHPELNMTFVSACELIKETGYILTFTKYLRDKFIAILKNASFTSYNCMKCNELAIIFFLLKALDRMAKEVWIPNWMEDSMGVLNKNLGCGYALYLKSERAIDVINKNIKMQDIDVHINFDTAFPHFVFWKIGALTLDGITIPPPSTYCINTDSIDIDCFADDSDEDGGFLQIAYIPFSKPVIEEQSHVQCCLGDGTQIVWRYQEQNAEAAVQRTLNILEEVLSNDPHIVIFPEYCIGPQQLDGIKTFLEKRSNNTKSKLLFVVAGSTWITDKNHLTGEDSHNNICHVLDRWGNEIGRYYKFSPYGENSENSHERVEGLSSPGRENTLLYVKGYGYVQIAICRDIINTDYPALFAKAFCPTLMLVPAWSQSNGRFYEPFAEFVRKYLTTVGLCNCCMIVKGDVVGFMGIPNKGLSDIEMTIQNCSRGKTCIDHCLEKKCHFIGSVQYRANHKKTGINVNLSQHGT